MAIYINGLTFDFQMKMKNLLNFLYKRIIDANES